MSKFRLYSHRIIGKRLKELQILKLRLEEIDHIIFNAKEEREFIKREIALKEQKWYQKNWQKNK